MRVAQLEAVVLEAIRTLQRGVRVEDDRIEFKADWPGPDKARQLAGAANRARGEDLIYVIGVSDTDGSILDVSDTDPSTWFDQMKGAFDQDCAPDLFRHVRLAVPDAGSVVVLLFDTERAPYVVKVNNREGRPTDRLEVPIRVATGTRSAHRSDLLRLLYPTVTAPRVEILSAKMTLAESGPQSSPAATLDFSAAVYFEYLHASPVFLPIQAARAELSGGPSTRRTELHYWPKVRASARIVEPFKEGLSPRADGLDVTGCGAVSVHAQWKSPLREMEALGEQSSYRVKVMFGVAGADHGATAETTLMRQTRKDVRDPYSDAVTRAIWTTTD